MKTIVAEWDKVLFKLRQHGIHGDEVVTSLIVSLVQVSFMILGMVLTYVISRKLKDEPDRQ